MKWRATLTNGDRWTVDVDARAVTPDPGNSGGPIASLVGPTAENLLSTGDPIGPQVDDFAGIRGDWADPRAPLAAMIAATRGSNLHVLGWEQASPV